MKGVAVVMIALASLYVVAGVRLVTVNREITAKQVAEPLFEALKEVGIEPITETELEETLDPMMDTFTEEELSAIVTTIESGEISPDEWKAMWADANAKANADSATTERVVAVAPIAQRNLCSPANVEAIIRKICGRNFFCLLFFNILVDVVAYLKKKGFLPTHGGGCGDPHMFGFDGSSFLFLGDLDHTFNILSDEKFALHAKLMEAGAEKQLYFGTFEIHASDMRVTVEANRDTEAGLATGKQERPSLPH